MTYETSIQEGKRTIPPAYAQLLEAAPLTRERLYRVHTPTGGGRQEKSIDALVVRGRDGLWLSLQRCVTERVASADRQVPQPCADVRYDLNVMSDQLRAGHNGPRRVFKIVETYSGPQVQNLYERLSPGAPHNGYGSLEEGPFMRHI